MLATGKRILWICEDIAEEETAHEGDKSVTSVACILSYWQHLLLMKKRPAKKDVTHLTPKIE